MMNIKHLVGGICASTSRELGDEVLGELNKLVPIPISELDIGTTEYCEVMFNEDVVSISIVPKFEGNNLAGFEFQSDYINELKEPHYVETTPAVSKMYDNVLLSEHLYLECDTPIAMLIDNIKSNNEPDL